MTRRKPRTARIRIRRSFGGVHKGDEMDLLYNATVAGWIAVGLAEEIPRETTTGPGAADSDDDERESSRAAGSESSGGEPGSGAGPGGHGSSAVVDPGGTPENLQSPGFGEGGF